MHSGPAVRVAVTYQSMCVLNMRLRTGALQGQKNESIENNHHYWTSGGAGSTSRPTYIFIYALPAAHY